MHTHNARTGLVHAGVSADPHRLQGQRFERFDMLKLRHVQMRVETEEQLDLSGDVLGPVPDNGLADFLELLLGVLAELVV
jgi:hypothetical protein